MDLYVERQCIDKIKKGEVGKFLMLFEACFGDLYKYVTRRVTDRQEIERIVKMTFFDALSAAQNIPTDTSFLVWLYKLARPRIWAYLNKVSMPEQQGLIAKKEEPEAEELIAKAEKMIAKLSLEEREILRLKFFEQVADGDVMTILEIAESAIGPKIYRVLKRAHFLLFGESDERQGVYFGELSSFMERVREQEEIEIPQVLFLTLKNDLTTKIERKDFAINADVVTQSSYPEDAKPFAVVDKETKLGKKTPKGSGDPAKIFVEAVREMKEEEALNKIKEARREERRSNLIARFDRWKPVFVAIPLLAFVVVVAVFLIKVISTGGISRGYLTDCNIEVEFDGDFSDGEKRSVNAGISDRICGHFEDVERLYISRTDSGKVIVAVDIKDWFLEYNFVKKITDWRIKKYARTLNSDGESGEV